MNSNTIPYLAQEGLKKFLGKVASKHTSSQVQESGGGFNPSGLIRNGNSQDCPPDTGLRWEVEFSLSETIRELNRNLATSDAPNRRMCPHRSHTSCPIPPKVEVRKQRGDHMACLQLQ